MSKQLPAYLLNRYLKGQCTPDEEALVENWYNSFEDDTDYFAVTSTAERNELKDRIRSRIQDSVFPIKNTKREWLRTLSYVAYSLSGIAAIFIIYFALSRPVKVQQTGESLIVITNNTRNIFKQVLSDGSHVWMMPGAQIRYTRVFTGNKRQVNLSGESFFEVTKNPSKPFIVYSSNLVTKVWGTSFRVRDSKYLSFADVTVLTGKVSVKLLHPKAFHSPADNKPANEVMIYPNEQVSYAKKEHKFTEQSKANVQDLLIWKKQSLSFDNAPIKDVIPVLNRAFNININTADQKTNEYLLTADFNGLNFPEIMEIIHKALNVNYEMNGRYVIIKETK